MTAADPFIDQLERELRAAYLRHVSRRSRRRLVAVVAMVVAVAAAATAAAAPGLLGWFTIDQGTVVSIPDPPQQIFCNPSGCVLGAGPPPAGRLSYLFSHTLGEDLPNSGRIAESLPGQGVFDPAGRTIVPPAGAELAYVCTALTDGAIDCAPLASAGATLPRGAAIYVLAPSAYVPAR